MTLYHAGLPSTSPFDDEYRANPLPVLAGAAPARCRRWTDVRPGVDHAAVHGGKRPSPTSPAESKAFTPRAVEELRPVAREVIRTLVDDVVDRGECDEVAAFCEPYPIPIRSR